MDVHSPSPCTPHHVPPPREGKTHTDRHIHRHRHLLPPSMTKERERQKRADDQPVAPFALLTLPLSIIRQTDRQTDSLVPFLCCIRPNVFGVLAQTDKQRDSWDGDFFVNEVGLLTEGRGTKGGHAGLGRAMRHVVARHRLSPLPLIFFYALNLRIRIRIRIWPWPRPRHRATCYPIPHLSIFQRTKLTYHTCMSICTLCLTYRSPPCIRHEGPHPSDSR